MLDRNIETCSDRNAKTPPTNRNMALCSDLFRTATNPTKSAGTCVPIIMFRNTLIGRTQERNGTHPTLRVGVSVLRSGKRDQSFNVFALARPFARTKNLVAGFATIGVARRRRSARFRNLQLRGHARGLLDFRWFYAMAVCGVTRGGNNRGRKSQNGNAR